MLKRNKKGSFAASWNDPSLLSKPARWNCKSLMQQGFPDFPARTIGTFQAASGGNAQRTRAMNCAKSVQPIRTIASGNTAGTSGRVWHTGVTVDFERFTYRSPASLTLPA